MGSHLCGKRTSQKLLQLDKILPHYWKGNFLLYVTRMLIAEDLPFNIWLSILLSWLPTIPHCWWGEFGISTIYNIPNLQHNLSAITFKMDVSWKRGTRIGKLESGIGNWLLEFMKFVLLYRFPFPILENILSPTFIVNSGSWFSKKALLDVRRLRVKADFSLYPYKPCTLTALSEDEAKLS